MTADRVAAAGCLGLAARALTLGTGPAAATALLWTAAAWGFWTRGPASAVAGPRAQAVAVSGATAGAAVLALAPPETALAGALASLALVGASKAAWDLRSAFAVLPAARGVVDHGAYRWLRHPMYAWQLVALLPGAVGNSWGWLWLVAAGLQVWRIREEEHVLGGLGDDWEAYTLRVRWRLVPGVW